MTKWLWSGVVVATIGVGTAGTIYWRHSSEPPTCCITSERPVPDPVTPAETPTSATLAQPSETQPLPVIRDDVDEPIVTRSETFDEPPMGNSLETALTVGGMKESDATTVLAPRPDRDPRRMPYADDVAPSAVAPTMVWLPAPGPGSILFPGIIARIGVTPPDAVEESEEPPFLDDALPPCYYPSHCPDVDQCPFPSNSYRTVVPR